MIATIMSANVLVWIIPGQRKVVAALKAGQPVDPIHGKRGKQRSVHNTYFTLPVLFAMLSNHYSMTYSFKYNWLVLVMIMAAGVFIRQFFILKHKGKINVARPAVGVALLAGVAVMIAPQPRPAVAASDADGAANGQLRQGAGDHQRPLRVVPRGPAEDDADRGQGDHVRLGGRDQVARAADLPAGGAAEDDAAGQRHADHG